MQAELVVKIFEVAHGQGRSHLHLLLHLRFQLLGTPALSLACGAWMVCTIVAVASVFIATLARIFEEQLLDGRLLVGKGLVMRDEKLANSDDCDDLPAQIGQVSHEVGGQEVYLCLLGTLGDCESDETV